MIANCLRTVTHMHLCTHGGMAMSIRERVAVGTLRASAHARVRPSKYDCACRIRTRPCMRSRAPLQACLRAYVHARAHVSAYGGYRRALVFFRMCACMFARVRIRALECRRESLCIGPWYTYVWAYARARKPTYERARSCVHARGKESVLVCKCVRARVRAHDARPCCVNIDTLRCVCSRFRIVYVCVRARAYLCTRAFAFEYT